MPLFKTKSISILFIIIYSIFLLGSGATNLCAAKKKHKKANANYEQQVQQNKAERIKKLYQYFPIYEEWEKAEIYPYNDFVFLNNFDRKSIFEDFYLRKCLIATIND